MISRKYSETGQSPSINQHQQAIHGQFNFSSINHNSHQKGRQIERGTQQKNSFLLNSYDKYEDNQRYGYQQRESNTKSKQIYPSQQLSTHKSHLNNSPSFNPQPIIPSSQIHPTIPSTSTMPSQYQLLLQYQLKRERQKCQILQKRLNNKQQFIKEMKSIQQQITMAYAKCQQQLNEANTTLYELKTNSVRQIRDYKEQIQELRHQIAVLQGENKRSVAGNNYHGQISRKMSVADQQLCANFPTNCGSLYYNNQSIKRQIEAERKYAKSKSTINLTRHQSAVEGDHGKISSVAAKKSSLGNPQFANLRLIGLNLNQNQSKVQQSIRQNVQHDKNMTRSNTHSVLVTDHNKKSTENLKTIKQMAPQNSQYSSISPIYRVENNTFNPLHIFKSRPELSQFQIEITQNISKVSNFLHHFIDMCQKMMEIELQQNKGPNNHDEKQPKQQGKKDKNKLIHQLKKYWKWIKQVIRQWKDMKDQKRPAKHKSHKQLFTLSKNPRNPQTQYIEDGQQFIETLGNQQTFQYN